MFTLNSVTPARMTAMSAMVSQRREPNGRIVSGAMPIAAEPPAAPAEPRANSLRPPKAK